jgi:hypothetical protein
MEAPGITTEELEIALGGMYAAPGDPDAPDLAEVGAEPVPVRAGTGITVGEMSSILGDMYIPPSLEEAA